MPVHVMPARGCQLAMESAAASFLHQACDALYCTVHEWRTYTLNLAFDTALLTREGAAEALLSLSYDHNIARIQHESSALQHYYIRDFKSTSARACQCSISGAKMASSSSWLALRSEALARDVNDFVWNFVD